MDQELRGERTRQAILDAARDLVVQKGWTAVTNRAVAERAGVNLALINYHFGGKRPMLAAMLERSAGRVLEEFAPPDPGPDLEHFLHQIVEAVPRASRDPDTRVIASGMMEALHDETFRESLQEDLQGLRDYLQETFVKLGVEGDHLSGMVTLTAALLDGLLLHHLLDPDTDINGTARALTLLVPEPHAD